MDDLTLSYEATEKAPLPNVPGFRVRMGRTEGQGGIEIVVASQAVGEPLKAQIDYASPSSVPHCKEVLDLAEKALLAEPVTPWIKVVAQVMLAAECAVPGDNAVEFISSELLQSQPGLRRALGEPLEFVSVKFEVAGQASSESLATPKRVLSLEVLRADSTRLYTELRSTWQQLTVNRPEDFDKVRPIDRRPSEYVEDARLYMERQLRELDAQEAQ